MKYLINLILVLCLLIAISSCEKGILDGDNQVLQDVKFTTVIQNSSYIVSDKAFNKVIKSSDEAQKFINETLTNRFDEHGNRLKLTFPVIDFNKDMFIAICSGSSSSGSIRLSINAISESDSKLYVDTYLYVPFIGTDDIGHPLHIIKLPRTDKTVIFKDIKTIKETENTVTSLVGSTWKWMSFVDASGTKLSLKDYAFFKEEPYFSSENFTINFKSDTKVDGRAGCNEWYANLSGDNTQIGINELVSTKVACFMTTEFMNGLRYSYKYEIVNNQLVLYCLSDSQIKTLYFDKVN